MSAIGKLERSGRRAVLAAGLLAGLLPVAVSPIQAAEATTTPKKTVILVMMPGKPTVHIIEMPSMERCRDAAEHTPSAICVETTKAGQDLNPDALKEYVPASGPTASEDGVGFTYKPLN